ncbi:hypothetical protein FV226_18235 [Methylobacterium sp. WL12]|nr:hypothetical protein FV229_11805 [Methylobacterium sp. WL120]TXM69730.1 hypothetical protein FV226_18235 [Methylobacterium sp. WL12]TXN79002.1 hypothetical protein FV234_21855 [Methylobacterium sp. WL8]
MTKLIRVVHASPQGLTLCSVVAAEKQRELTPAEYWRFIQPEGMISFEDGKEYKTLSW